jgi:NADPH:quinone reductase-like Zn-dependent oxidoreductase
MALVSGGGYGQFVKVPRSHVMKKPEKLKFTEAAVIT